MKKTEHLSPRSQSKSTTLLLGRDSRGHWVVQDPRHQCGGLFLNRADAVKFALFDYDNNRPRAVILVPGILELDVLKKSQKFGKVAEAAPEPLDTYASKAKF